MTLTPNCRWLRFSTFGLIVVCTAASSCEPMPEPEEKIGDGPVPAKNEIVMSPGMKITATTSTGTIAITAGRGLKRSYTWEGATRSVEMQPRQDRWYGSLGLYFPGPGDHWQEHNGISRGVVEEGQQHFKTVEEAMKWIAEQSGLPLVYRDDGLAVGWKKEISRRQLNVDVWQIYVDGKRASELAGSHDDKIVVEEPPSPSAAK